MRQYNIQEAKTLQFVDDLLSFDASLFVGRVVTLKVIQRPQLNLLLKDISLDPVGQKFPELICGVFMGGKRKDIVKLLERSLLRFYDAES